MGHKKNKKSLNDKNNILTFSNNGKILAFIFVTLFLLLSLFLASHETKKTDQVKRQEVQRKPWLDEEEMARINANKDKIDIRPKFRNSEVNPDHIVDSEILPNYHLIHSRITRGYMNKPEQDAKPVEFSVINEFWCEVPREILDEMQKERGKEIDELLAKGIKHKDFNKYLTKQKEHGHVKIKLSEFLTREDAARETEKMLNSEEKGLFKEGSFTGTEIGEKCWRLDLENLPSKVKEKATDRTNLFFHKNNVIVEIEIKHENEPEPEIIEKIAERIAEKY
jgi:hypothetical protein